MDRVVSLTRGYAVLEESALVKRITENHVGRAGDWSPGLEIVISFLSLKSIYLYILSQPRKEDIRTGAKRHRAKKKKEYKAR